MQQHAERELFRIWRLSQEKGHPYELAQKFRFSTKTIIIQLLEKKRTLDCRIQEQALVIATP